MKATRTIGFLLAFCAIGLFVCPPVEARIFRFRGAGCGSGCNTGVCNVNVSEPNDSAASTDFAFNPIRRPSPPKDDTRPVLAKGEKGDPGPAGPQGPAGPPGEITQTHLDQIVAAVVPQVRDQLLAQIKTDATFRGPAGENGKSPAINVEDIARQVRDSIDVDQIADQVALKLPPIKVELLGDGNRVASTQTVKLGGTIRIPPITLRSINPDGAVASKTDAVGSNFTVRFDKFE